MQSKLLSYAVRALPWPCLRLGVLVQVIVRSSELPERGYKKKSSLVQVNVRSSLLPERGFNGVKFR